MNSLPIADGFEKVAEAASEKLPNVLLVGNPNAGKTSLFNAISGLRSRTANYPGITVEFRRATIPVSDDLGTHEIDLIDLPGLYGVEPTSPEEKVAAEAIRGDIVGPATLIVITLDATNLARNLFLAEQVLQLGQPTLVVLNMMDVVRQQGASIDVAELASQLDCEVIAVSARTGEGLAELKAAICRQTRETIPSPPSPRQSCTAGCTGCTFAARHEWADRVCGAVVQNDNRPQPALGFLDKWLTSTWIGTACLAAVMLLVFFTIFSLADLPMSLIEDTFGWLGAKVESVLPTQAISGWIWKPLIAGLSMFVFGVSYRLSEQQWTWLATTFAVGVSIAVALLPLEDFRSLAIDGVIGGIAGVVVFLPQICILFFFIALLEDTGYMARAAFVMERWMRWVGLPGKAFVPMLSAHACAIPGIMATRTIENWRDRLVTILVLPMLTCSARLPVYAMISALLFDGQPVYAALMFAAAYLLGLFAALGTAFLLKKTVLQGEAAPLVIELPSYRIPSLRNALLAAADRAMAFLKTAGGLILLISVVLWAMATYPKPPQPSAATQVTQSTAAEAGEIDENAMAQSALEYSMAGRLGKSLEPIFSPLGFDWKINVGVVTSFAAREVLVSTLSVIYGVGEDGAEDNDGLVNMLRRQERSDGTPVFDLATSASLLVFFVLAMQCLPTQAVTRRETGTWKWAIFQFVFMTVLAYVAAFGTYQLLSNFS